MTKKDFILIARIMRETRASPHIVEALARELQLTNPNFKSAVFVAACTEWSDSEVKKGLARLKMTSSESETVGEDVLSFAEQALLTALPFVEDCEYSSAYKPGVVEKAVRLILDALAAINRHTKE